MEVLRELPNHLKFNVLKYLQHPTAAIMRTLVEKYGAYRRKNVDGLTFAKFSLENIWCENNQCVVFL